MPKSPDQCGTEGHATIVDNDIYYRSKKVAGSNSKEPYTKLALAPRAPMHQFVDAVAAAKDQPLVSLREAAARVMVMKAMCQAAHDHTLVNVGRGLVRGSPKRQIKTVIQDTALKPEKQRLIFISAAGILLMVALAAVLSGVVGIGEPRYGGRPVSHWVNELALSDGKSYQQSSEALRALGEKALPYLTG
ncbi:MAG: hypothetical protein DME24_14080, partial [Verrucomicrobia bacterium]